MLLDVYSDVICPWCYIGKRRLDKVMETSAGDGVEMHWRAFQLYPMIPAEGVDRDAYMKARFGDRAQPSRIYEQIVSEGESEGIEFRFERIKRMPNTLDAHRLVSMADEHGVQNRLLEALFSAYFCEGEDIGDPDVLADVGARGGLDIDRVRAYLDGDEGREAVGRELEWGQVAGISGVPCFILERELAMPGAQDAQTLGMFFERVKAKLESGDIAPAQ
ncbi:MAG: DsbA family oxidoreductase [Gammaproteobacteria bacterium]|jgi:predicted DsbA family dithiol-disulfide isomerase|nr:DsbA family oxidoreductase [Gammaproteobacteria bacterium]